MDIYGIDDKVIISAILTKEAEHEEEMMKSDFVKLSWKSDEKVKFPAGSYIIPFSDGLKYRLFQPYEPEQIDSATWKYEPEFQHPKMWLSKLPFTMTRPDSDGSQHTQLEWSYTGILTGILQDVCDFINDLFGFSGDDKFTYTIVGNADTTVSVSCSNVDVLSALSSIASACKDYTCEWHLDWGGKALYFGQIAYNKGEGTTPVLKVGDNVEKASVNKSSRGYYNVFRPQGSTKNMSKRLDTGENVSSSLRLELNKKDYPDGVIDMRTDSKEPKMELGLIFDDDYPHVDLYAYNVRKETRYILDKSTGKYMKDHLGNYLIQTIWYMRLAYPTYDTNGKVTGWTDYAVDTKKQVLAGYDLCGTFKANTHDGALASTLVGLPSNADGFEIKYHDGAETIYPNTTSGDSGMDVLLGDYEIMAVTAGNDSTFVPSNESDGLIPRGESTPSLKGNIVVLYNIAMGDTEVTSAQNDLKNNALKEIAQKRADLNNYAFNSDPTVFEKSNPDLYIGRKVTYDDNNGYTLSTRVLKLVTKLDHPYEQEITVGNQRINGPVTQLKEDVKTVLSGDWEGAGLNPTQVKNLISNYTSIRYLSKTTDDTAAGLITFLKGLVSDSLAYLKSGAQFGNFVSSIYAGKGGAVDDKGNAELRSLTLREFLEVPEFRYNRIEIQIGNRWRAPGGGIIESFTPDKDADGNELSTGIINLHLEDGEIGTIGVDDICQGIYHDGMTLSNNSTDDYDDGVGNFRFSGFYTCYFRITEIIETGNNSSFRYALRPVSDNYPTQYQPHEAMHFVGYGNFTDSTRQSSRYSTLTYERYLTGVKTWEFSKSMVAAQFGDLSNLNVFGLSMAGYSAYLDNIYMSGTIEQFEKLPVRIDVTNSGDGFLAYGESCDITCKVMRGFTDLTDTVSTWTITRDSGSTPDDEAWNLSDKAKGFDGTITLAFTETENDIGSNSNVYTTIFTVTAIGSDGAAIASAEITI
nr:hypothetical protein [uncultured Prevotella sp.]